MNPYSLDLRQRAIERYQENPNFRAVAKQLKVSHIWVRDRVVLWKNTGSLEAQHQNCGRPATIGKQEKQWLRQWLDEGNGLALKELRQRLTEQGVTVSHTAIDNALGAMRITRKKMTVAVERNRPDVREKRERWYADTVADIPARHPVFLDENGANI